MPGAQVCGGFLDPFSVLLAPDPFVTVAVPGAAVKVPEAVLPFFPVALPDALTAPALALAEPVAVPPLGPVALPCAVTLPDLTVAVPEAVAVFPFAPVAVAVPLTLLPF